MHIEEALAEGGARGSHVLSELLGHLGEHDQTLHLNVADPAALNLLQIGRRETAKLGEDLPNLHARRERRDMKDGADGLEEAHVAEHLLIGGGANHHELTALGRHAAEEDEKGL